MIRTASRRFGWRLREIGYIEGQNIAIEYRYAQTKRERLPELVAELVGLKVDILLAISGDAVIRAAMNGTKTIPIIITGAVSIPSRQAWWKALPAQAATSPALQTFPET